MSERPAGRIVPPEALTGPAAGAVVAALAADGAEVRFVGGCVRDALLGRDVEDVDIATPDRPDAVLALLERAGIKGAPTGLAHGTVTAVADGRPFQVTTLRIDVETDGRHAEVAFTDSFEADAARRDFTINAMSLDPSGDLFDYVGGRADLDAGRVRFVGDAGARIAEDYLRVLRYFRFLARYGRGLPEPSAVEACRDAAGKLGRLSAERIQTEMLKTLGAPNPAPAVELMRETGVLRAVLPEAGPSDVLLALVGIDDRDPLRRLAALAPSGGRALAARLKLPNAMAERLAALSPPLLKPPSSLSSSARRRMLYDLGVSLFRDLVLLAWAADRDGAAPRWRAMLDEAHRWERPELPVRGGDVLAAGVTEGPDVGRLLAEIENWWRERDFLPDRRACLDRLSDLAP